MNGPLRETTPVQVFARACRIHAEHVAGMGDGRMGDDEYPHGGVPRGLLDRDRPHDPGAAYWCRKYVRDWKRRRRAWRKVAPKPPMPQPATGVPEMIRELTAPPALPSGPTPTPEEDSAIPKSGQKGIYWHKGSKRWQVQLSIGGKVRSFGLHPDIAGAVAARDAALASDPVEPVPAPVVPAPPVPPAPAPVEIPRMAASPPIAAPAPDPEVDAIGSIAKALSGLDVEASRRVIDWAIARYAARSAGGQP